MTRASSQDGKPHNGSGADRSQLQTLQRAARLLEELAGHTAPQTAAALSAAVGMERTIVYRLLRTLQVEGLVVSNREGYRLGPRTLRFGNAFRESLPLRQAAVPFYSTFRDTFLADKPWILHISIPVGDRIVAVDQLFGQDAPLDMLMSRGLQQPLDETASGRCALAFLAPEDARERVGDERFAAVSATLDTIRAAGQEIQHHVGSLTVAVPVLDRDSALSGVLSVGIPGFDPEPPAGIGRRLQHAAASITSMLR